MFMIVIVFLFLRNLNFFDKKVTFFQQKVLFT